MLASKADFKTSCASSSRSLKDNAMASYEKTRCQVKEGNTNAAKERGGGVFTWTNTVYHSSKSRPWKQSPLVSPVIALTLSLNPVNFLDW